MDLIEQYTAPQHTPDSKVAVFQVLCSLYGLTCVGYAQNSLEFISHSPLVHAKNLVLHSSHFTLNWRCCTATL